MTPNPKQFNLEAFEEEIAEHGCLHNKNCCCNTEYGCDTDVGMVDCCENMILIAGIVKQAVTQALEAMMLEKKDKEQVMWWGVPASCISSKKASRAYALGKADALVETIQILHQRKKKILGEGDGV